MSKIPVFLKNIYIPARIWIENNLINLSSTNDISNINDKIFIGNFSTSTNKELLKENGITHILSCISHYTPLYPDEFTYKHIKSYDILDFNLFEFFDETNKFIQEGTANNNKIYIHCMYGVSRSVTIVLAYFLKYNKESLSTLLEKIREKRPIANPNESFMEQLEQFRQLL